MSLQDREQLSGYEPEMLKAAFTSNVTSSCRVWSLHSPSKGRHESTLHRASTRPVSSVKACRPTIRPALSEKKKRLDIVAWSVDGLVRNILLFMQHRVLSRQHIQSVWCVDKGYAGIWLCKNWRLNPTTAVMEERLIVAVTAHLELYDVSCPRTGTRRDIPGWASARWLGYKVSYEFHVFFHVADLSDEVSI